MNEANLLRLLLHFRILPNECIYIEIGIPHRFFYSKSLVEINLMAQSQHKGI